MRWQLFITILPNRTLIGSLNFRIIVHRHLYRYLFRSFDHCLDRFLYRFLDRCLDLGHHFDHCLGSDRCLDRCHCLDHRYSGHPVRGGKKLISNWLNSLTSEQMSFKEKDYLHCHQHPHRHHLYYHPYLACYHLQARLL